MSRDTQDVPVEHYSGFSDSPITIIDLTTHYYYHNYLNR